MHKENVERLYALTKDDVAVLEGLCAEDAALTREAVKDVAERVARVKEVSRDFFAGFGETLPPEVQKHKEAVHALTGTAVTASRLYLDEADRITEEEVRETYRKLHVLLKTGAYAQVLPDAAAQLYAAARDAGIKLTITSPIPEDEMELRGFIRNASMKMLQAIREGKDVAVL